MERKVQLQTVQDKVTPEPVRGRSAYLFAQVSRCAGHPLLEAGQKDEQPPGLLCPVV
ncbi:MAG TPA: hypothetical protein VD969_29685 [Symbiobacteriaceae bacterium]|nr:hypothetical protein [Symbiobacteriaceae bacterium]